MVLEGREGLGLLLTPDGTLVVQRDGASRVESWGTLERAWVRVHALLAIGNDVTFCS